MLRAALVVALGLVAAGCGGDREVASASFDGRSIGPDCGVVADGTLVTMERSPYDGELLGDGVYRAVELRCEAGAEGFDLDVHPIFYGSDTVDGSNVLVIYGSALVVAAVLKDEGNPYASRIAYAPEYCTPAD